MIDFWWSQISVHFPCVELDQHVIMPNHIHAIINIVGADRCVRPILNNIVRHNSDIDTHDHVVSIKNDRAHFQNSGRTRRSAPTVSEMMQWFKTMTTNDYIKNVKTNNWPTFNKHVWQRSFYDHVIRNERSLNAIREYILDNPVNWQQDIENLLNL
jgi:REP element-mobilizing transposase RayT